MYYQILSNVNIYATAILSYFIEFSENIRIGQDQSLQHFDRCLLKLGNGDLQIAELPDSIHIPLEKLHEIQDDSGIAIWESIRHFVEKIFFRY